MIIRIFIKRPLLSKNVLVIWLVYGPVYIQAIYRSFPLDIEVILPVVYQILPQ